MIRTSSFPNPRHRGLTLVPAPGQIPPGRKPLSDLEIVAHWVSQSLKALNPIHSIQEHPKTPGTAPPTPPL
jgi:hypothetical protein